jgi:hypothetical protein
MHTFIIFYSSYVQAVSRLGILLLCWYYMLDSLVADVLVLMNFGFNHSGSRGFFSVSFYVTFNYQIFYCICCLVVHYLLHLFVKSLI